MTGRILVDGRFKGIGFALTPRVTLTAGHVVRGHDPTSLLVADLASEPIHVQRVDIDEELDVAVLLVATDVEKTLLIGPVVEGARWVDDAQPRTNDPGLDGVITTARRPFVNARKHRVEGVQLHVEQELGDYGGYSGSPIMSPLGVAVGVLVEQLPRRNRTLTGEPSLSSNVLYAIAVIDVVAKFGINAVRAQEALLDKARADVPQTSAPFEAMQHFRKVWYRPHGTGAVDVVKMRAMTDRGSLTVSPDGLRFEGNWTSFDLADIARVSLRRSGKDFVNNWAVVECADGRTAQFADGRNHGWSGILGGTRKIFDAIAGIARQPAQP